MNNKKLGDITEQQATKIEVLAAEYDTRDIAKQMEDAASNLIIASLALAYQLFQDGDPNDLTSRLKLIMKQMQEHEEPLNEPYKNKEFSILAEQFGYNKVSAMWSSIILIDMINSQEFKHILKRVNYAKNHCSRN